MRNLLLNTALIATCTSVGSTNAATVTFDFEQFAPSVSGDLSRLVMSRDGLTAVLTRPGSRFDVTDVSELSPGIPPQSEQRVLDPFSGGTSATPFVLSFSRPVDSVTVYGGDYGQDTPDILKVTAFSAINGAGTNLAFSQKSIETLDSTTNPFNYAPVTINSSNAIRSVAFIGGTQQFPNSLYYDNITVSFGQAVAPPLAESSAVVYIDFDKGVSAFFDVVRNSFNGKETYAVSDGYMSAPNFSQNQRDMIVSEVQRIFSTSGIDVLVTQVKPTSGTFYSVEMGKPLDGFDSDGNGVDDALLTGKAYDIVDIKLLNMALGNMGIDRFDQRKDGRVAVFLDAGSEIYKVAETIAHEVGHGLGGFHIDPNASGSQVMDYTDAAPGTAVFFNQSTRMIDFNRGGNALADTHNPQYHLRRFVDGETKSSLSTEGLQPGTWDALGFVVFGYQIDLSSLSNLVSSWFVAFNDASSNLESLNGDSVDTEYSLFDISSLIDQNGIFKFNLTTETKMSIFGKSIGSNMLDIALGASTGLGVGQLLDFTQITTGELVFFQNNPANGTLNSLSEASMVSTGSSYISPDVSPIPLPSSVLQLLFGLLMLGLIGRYKQANN